MFAPPCNVVRTRSSQIFTRRRDSSEPAAQVTFERFDCKFPFWSSDSRNIYYASVISYQRAAEVLWNPLRFDAESMGSVADDVPQGGLTALTDLTSRHDSAS